MVLEIKTFPDKVLRGKAEPVETVTEEIKELLYNMADTMYDAPGIGLAAPQVGVLKRVVVIDVTAGQEPGKLMNLINPEILEASGTELGEEGCLSVPGEYEYVNRAEFVRVRAVNEDGETVEFEAEGILARAVQHEIDHLNGRLFIDHLPGMKKESVKKRIKRRINDGDYVVTGS